MFIMMIEWVTVAAATVLEFGGRAGW